MHERILRTADTNWLSTIHEATFRCRRYATRCVNATTLPAISSGAWVAVPFGHRQSSRSCERPRGFSKRAHQQASFARRTSRDLADAVRGVIRLYGEHRPRTTWSTRRRVMAIHRSAIVACRRRTLWHTQRVQSVGRHDRRLARCRGDRRTRGTATQCRTVCRAHARLHYRRLRCHPVRGHAASCGSGSARFDDRHVDRAIVAGRGAHRLRIIRRRARALVSNQ